MYIQLFIPISWETFLCFSSCVVARRHLCHVALAAPWLKPLASSIILLSPTAWLLTCATARVHRFLQMAAAVRAAPPGCRKGELLRWASDYFLSGEKDNDLWVWESSTHALPAEIGSLTNGSSSSVAAILLYLLLSYYVVLPCLIVLMLWDSQSFLILTAFWASDQMKIWPQLQHPWIGYIKSRFLNQCLD